MIMRVLLNELSHKSRNVLRISSYYNQLIAAILYSIILLHQRCQVDNIENTYIITIPILIMQNSRSRSPEGLDNSGASFV